MRSCRCAESACATAATTNVNSSTEKPRTRWDSTRTRKPPPSATSPMDVASASERVKAGENGSGAATSSACSPRPRATVPTPISSPLVSRTRGARRNASAHATHRPTTPAASPSGVATGTRKKDAPTSRMSACSAAMDRLCCVTATVIRRPCLWVGESPSPRSHRPRALPAGRSPAHRGSRRLLPSSASARSGPVTGASASTRRRR
jgi:hypothetical protein